MIIVLEKKTRRVNVHKGDKLHENTPELKSVAISKESLNDLQSCLQVLAVYWLYRVYCWRRRRREKLVCCLNKKKALNAQCTNEILTITLHTMFKYDERRVH